MSSTQSLAALETLVHLNPPVLFQYVSFRIRFDDSLVESIPSSGLPGSWRSEPPAPVSKAVGDGWVRSGRTAVLEVPSVIVSSERNYLLNPAHPDFTRITIERPAPFAFDSRLLA